MASRDHSHEDASVDGNAMNVDALLLKVSHARSLVVTAPSQAIQIFVDVLKHFPSIKDELFQDVVLASHMYANEVAVDSTQTAEIQTVVNLYKRLIALYPMSFTLTHGLARVLFRRGENYFRDSFSCYQYAMLLVRRNAALENQLGTEFDTEAAVCELENLKAHILDRWHFRMLNDKCRNDAYAAAVNIVCRNAGGAGAKRGCVPARSVRVLDIGTGTGLLSVFAARVDPAVTAVGCDTNGTLCDTAVKVAKSNGLEGQIQIVNKHSKNLSGHDLNSRGKGDGKADVIVTELVDSGLLGEHIIPTLRHAKQHFLRPGGIVIPSSASIFAVCIEAPEIRRQQTVLHATREFLNSFVQPDATCTGHRFGDVVASTFFVAEPYTCTALDDLSHTRLTNPVQVGTIDFATAESGKTFSTVRLPVTASGDVDAIAMWFTLHLLPKSQAPPEHGRCDGPPRPLHTDISTAPKSDSAHTTYPACSGWDQGIFPVQVFGQQVQPSMHALDLTLKWGTGYLKFALHAGDTSRASSQLDLMEPASREHCSVDILRQDIGELDMAKLNNIKRFNAVATSLRRCGSQSPWPLNVLSLEDNFSLLSLVALSVQSCCVTCVTNSAKVANIYERLYSKLKPRTVATAGSFSVFPSLQQAFRVGIDDTSKSEKSGNDVALWNTLLCDVVEGLGILRQSVLRDVALANELTRLTCGGGGDHTVKHYIPSRVRVFCRAVESQKLLDQNEVRGTTNTCGVNVSDINSLSVRKFPGIDCRSLFGGVDANSSQKNRFLTPPKECLCFELAAIQSTEWSIPWQSFSLPPVSLDDDAQSAPCHAILFWFILEYPTVTGVHAMNTSDSCDGNHFRQAAVILRNSAGESSRFRSVRNGDEVRVEVRCTISYGIDFRIPN